MFFKRNREGTKHLGRYFSTIPDLLERKLSPARTPVGELRAMESSQRAEGKLLSYEKSALDSLCEQGVCAEDKLLKLPSTMAHGCQVQKAGTVGLTKD